MNASEVAVEGAAPSETLTEQTKHDTLQQQQMQEGPTGTTTAAEVRQVAMADEESKTVQEEEQQLTERNVENGNAAEARAPSEAAAVETETAAGQANNAATEEQPPASEEPQSEGEQIRRVMFETDKWEQCVADSVWFGQKIPQKRRMVGR